MSLSERRYDSALVQDARPAAKSAAPDADRVNNPFSLRLGLAAVCASAAAAAAYFAAAGGMDATADPGLARLLTGMAIIKTIILLAAGAVIWWRLGAAIKPGFAAGYILAAAAGVAGAVLVWNMTGLGVAPFLFDGGLLAFLILALRDDNGPWLHALTRGRSRRSE